MLNVADKGVAIMAEGYGLEYVVVVGIFLGFWGKYLGDVFGDYIGKSPGE